MEKLACFGNLPHEITGLSLPNEHHCKRRSRREIEARVACYATQVLGDINAQPGSQIIRSAIGTLSLVQCF
jgi:hypothetical protein